jgi:hypothetical protein
VKRVAALLVVLLAAARAEATELCLHDPDASLASVAELRSAFGAFLRSASDETRFQAFGKIADLARHMDESRVSFVIVGAAHAAELARHRLRAVLVPLRRGEPAYHKVLLVRRGTDPRAIRTVATTSPPAEVAAITVRGHSLAKTPALRVSKGIDAVLAMAFDRADAAYVTPETLEALAKVDAPLAASLEEIHRSPPIPNPQLYVVGDVPAPIVERMIAAFRAMDRTPPGRKVLRALNYDGWRSP